MGIFGTSCPAVLTSPGASRASWRTGWVSPSSPCPPWLPAGSGCPYELRSTPSRSVPCCGSHGALGLKHGGWRRVALSCRGVKEPSEEKRLENTRRVRGMQRGCQTPRWGVQNGVVPEQGMGFGCSAALEPWAPLPAPLGTGGWRGVSSWHGHCGLCRCPLMNPSMAQALLALRGGRPHSVLHSMGWFWGSPGHPPRPQGARTSPARLLCPRDTARRQESWGPR